MDKAAFYYYETSLSEALDIMKNGLPEETATGPNGKERTGIWLGPRSPEGQEPEAGKVRLAICIRGVTRSELRKRYGVGKMREKDVLVIPAEVVAFDKIQVDPLVGYCSYEKHPGPVEPTTYAGKRCWDCGHFENWYGEDELVAASGVDTELHQEDFDEAMEAVDEMYIELIRERDDALLMKASLTLLVTEKLFCSDDLTRPRQQEAAIKAMMLGECDGIDLPDGVAGHGYIESPAMWRSVAQQLREEDADLSKEEWAVLDKRCGADEPTEQ